MSAVFCLPHHIECSVNTIVKIPVTRPSCPSPPQGTFCCFDVLDLIEIPPMWIGRVAPTKSTCDIAIFISYEDERMGSGIVNRPACITACRADLSIADVSVQSVSIYIVDWRVIRERVQVDSTAFSGWIPTQPPPSGWIVKGVGLKGDE